MRFQVKMILVVRIMQHSVVVHLINARDCTDVAGTPFIDLCVGVAVQLQQLVDLDGFARITDKELIARSLSCPGESDTPQSALERIDVHHEHVCKGVRLRIRRDDDFLGIVTLTLQEQRRVALERIRHQALEYLKQLRNPGTGFRRNKTNRYQVTFAKAFSKGSCN